MKGIIFLVLAFLSPISAYPNYMCSKEENVNYFIYNYIVNITIYQCSALNNDQSCAEIPNVEYEKLRRHKHFTNIMKNCNKLSDCKYNEGLNNCQRKYVTQKPRLCRLQAEANLLANTINLSSNSNSINYSEGKYYDPSRNLIIIWLPQNICQATERVYHGPIDIWTLKRNEIRRYIIGTTAYSTFTLQLLEEVNFCGRNVWKTNQYGICASKTENKSTKKVFSLQESDRYLSHFRTDNLELACDLTTSLMYQSEKLAELQQTLYSLLIFGIIFAILIVIMSVVRCLVNYMVLRKSGKAGLTCFSTTLTSHYRALQKSEKKWVGESSVNSQDYVVVDNAFYNKVNQSKGNIEKRNIPDDFRVGGNTS